MKQSDMPDLYGHDVPDQCVCCGSFEDLRATESGYLCGPCIREETEGMDQDFQRFLESGDDEEIDYDEFKANK